MPQIEMLDPYDALTQQWAFLCSASIISPTTVIGFVIEKSLTRVSSVNGVPPRAGALHSTASESWLVVASKVPRYQLSQAVSNNSRIDVSLQEPAVNKVRRATKPNLLVLGRGRAPASLSAKP